MMNLTLVVIILLLLLVIRKKKTWVKKKSKMSKMFYKLIYADEKTNNKKIIQSKILTSEKFRLRGKPDYIIKNIFLDKYIPIEVKSRSIDDEEKPIMKDLIQLGVYFLLIEDNFKSRPKEGRLIYNDYMFVIKNNKHIRNLVLNTIDNMDSMKITGKGDVDASYIKCKLCICKNTVCEHIKEVV